MPETIRRDTEAKRDLSEATDIYNSYTNYRKRLRTIFAQEKKLLKKKEKLMPLEEPVLFLNRTDGSVEIYQGVKGTEFLVPGLPEGVEKKILLGRQFQTDIPHAGRTFKAYWCHEDWVFPHIWGKPTKYQGDIKEAPNDGWILTSANIASEIFRDRERKVLMAWEKFQRDTSKKDWVEIAKAIAIIIGVIVVALWAWNQFGPQPDPTPVINAAVGGVEL